jgi:hypothetical protein
MLPPILEGNRGQGGRMDNDAPRQKMPQYKPEAWRSDDALHSADNSDLPAEYQLFNSHERDPNVREQTLILDLLGRINYKILSGKRVYVEVGGVVYKTLYGGYWRSVFTGIEHYLLRCEQVSGYAWGQENSVAIDLPIAYSHEGWTASGHSLSFILNRDLAENQHSFVQRLRRFRSLRSKAAQ